MTAGDFNHLRKIIITALAASHVAGVNPILRQRLRAIWKLRQQFMTVVMKITAQGHRYTHTIKLLTYGRHLFRGLRCIDGNPNNFRASQSELLDLNGRRNRISRIGVGHGLNQHRGRAANQRTGITPRNGDRAGWMALNDGWTGIQVRRAHLNHPSSQAGSQAVGKISWLSATAAATSTTAAINTHQSQANAGRSGVTA